MTFLFKRRGLTAKSALRLARTFVKGYLLETIGFVNLDPDPSGGKERRAKLTETFNASAYLGAGNLAGRSKSSLMPKATRVICPGKWSRS